MTLNRIGSHNLHVLAPKIQPTKNIVQTNSKRNQATFDDILQDKLEEPTLYYSKHVTTKMQSLGIEMNQELRKQLETAVEKAKQKNIREGLILTKQYGFVVSIKNKTVITVVNLQHMQDNVFTNIDGAVLI